MAQLNDTMVQGDLRVTGSIYGNLGNALPVAQGGTAATTRLGALKNLTDENVGTSAQYFLTITASWAKGGYTSVADAKTVLGLKSAAYTASSNYMTAKPNVDSTNMNLIAAMGNCGGMAALSGTDTTVNPNGQTGWHHFLNLSYETQASNMWQTQIANAAGSTDLWVRSRKGGTVADGTAWVAPWTRILTGSNWSNVVTKSAIGLGNVNNTSDADKPISTATQTALEGKVAKAGDTMTGGLEIQGVKSGTSYANSGGGYNANYNNIILRGDPTYGTSGILFTSSKGTTSINQATDRGFIQFHSMGVTPVAEGSTPTMSSSGEANSLVIGVGNDGDDEVWIQTPAANGIKHVVGPTKYTVYDGGNLPAATSASAVATTSSAGSANTFSRGDHSHSISLATGDNDGQVKIAGSNVSVKGWGNDSDGNQINTTYLKLSGGTMTGKITAQPGQYTDDNVSCAINMNNSNIIGLNSIYTADASDGASEGIHFYRDATHVDTLWMAGGALYFVPNRALGTSTSAADSQKVARLPASIPDNQVVLTNGTAGALKTSTLDAACNLFINALSTGSSTPTDNDYYVAQYVGGGTTTTSYHRRPVSALWTYIKGKMTSVSGVNISGNAATATTATNYASSGGIATALDGKVDYGYVSDTSVIDSDSTAASCKTYFSNNVSPGRCKIVYCKNGDEYTLIFSKQGSGDYGSIIKYGYAKNTIYMLRYKDTKWESTDWEVISAGSVNATTGNSITSTGSNGSMEILNGALSSASGGGGSCSIDGDGISFKQGTSGSSMTSSSIATSGTGTFTEGASAKGRPIDGSATILTNSSLTWNAATTHLVVNRSAGSTTVIDLKSLNNSVVYWLHVPRDNIVHLKNSSAISTFYCYDKAFTTAKTTDTQPIRSHIKDSVHGGFSAAIVRSSTNFYVMMDY